MLRIVLIIFIIFLFFVKLINYSLIRLFSQRNALLLSIIIRLLLNWTLFFILKTIGIQKTWIPTVVVPRSEAFALPDIQEQQREAHAEYKTILSCYIVKVRVCAYMNMQKAYQQAQEG